MAKYVLFGVLFLVLFVGVWSLGVYIISKIGWASLAKKYETDRPFIGERIGIVSAQVNSGNYRNSIVLQHNEKGFYMQPLAPFRMFHPAVVIPWTEVKEVREGKSFLITYYELVVGDPKVVNIKLNAKTFEKLRSASKTGKLG